MGFKQSDADPCVFIKYQQNEIACIIAIFVYDCFVRGQDNLIASTTQHLMQHFKMHDLGPLSDALGIKITQSSDQISISQDAYVQRCLNKFKMTD